MRHRARSNPWILRSKPSAVPALRLFYFPPAGGGGSGAHAWRDELPPEIELCAVQPPGRETRLTEPPITEMPLLIEALTEAIEPELDRPFAFFGHSVGALVAFELGRSLRRRALREPCHLFVAARHAPQLPRVVPRLAHLPAHELIGVLRTGGLLPSAVAGDDSFLSMVLPTWRADLALSDGYRYRADVPFAFPISVFGGLSDAALGRAELSPWKTHTSKRFQLRMLRGGHVLQPVERVALMRYVLEDLKPQRG